MLLGAFVNFIAIIIGGGVGALLKQGVFRKVGGSLMNGMGLCTLYIGITGLFSGGNFVMIIVSVAIGGIIGEVLALDGKLNSFAKGIETKFHKDGSETSLAQGFVSASLIFCVGAMAVVGSLESGLSNNHDTLFTKSLIDGIAALSLASTLGAGVLLSSVPVLLYQGLITVTAGILQPLLTEAAVADMTVIGSLLIIATATNLLKVTDIKVLNFVPAIGVPLIYSLIERLF